ncbi:DUF2470 domain-containing protein [Streptomyces zagrosensis]|uniref:DUF2470 domain-containing protein n=1 Tax=Streptomyces zagrosensis TaxID=1042984 RepID=A0A7W9UYR1_9ACTN|nr:DUF2470 domain-containing protein [Streptomyces zagrosensis]MBB5935611.1 hypothetical protein [Streptomyces zagrosensis]
MFRPGSPMPSPAQTAESDDSGPNGTEVGQPRPAEDARQPMAAERVRTLVEGKATASLAIPGIDESEEFDAGAPTARTVTPDGDVLLLVPGGSPAARAAMYAQDDDLACVMEITDVAPVSVPYRVRGRAWIAGWLTPVRNEERAACAMLLAERHPVGEILGMDDALRPATVEQPAGRPAWALLRLEVGEACVDDLWGAEGVEPDAFAEASADPLVAHEADLLQHLHSAHSEQVHALCALLGERASGRCGAAREPGGQPSGEGCAAPGRAVRAVPVSLTRFGLRVRFTDTADRSFDARFDFPEPVSDVVELRRAMHGLFEAAAE